MLTTFDDDAYVIEAINIGAVGYLLKDRPPENLIAVIRAILTGGTLIDPGIAKRVVRSTSSVQNAGDEPYTEWVQILTIREFQLLEYLSKGLSNKEISSGMNIAEQTVKNYISIIYSKIGIHSRYNLIAKAKDYFG